MAVCDKSLTRFPVPDATETEPHYCQLLVRKSRFLAQCCHASSSAAARDFISLVRSRHPGATHNCWAYVAGRPGETGNCGFTDDGEPHGTAGRPILQVLQHSGIGQICMVVTRWFGGIKLGTGGLARAYQDAALQNIKTLPVHELVPCSVWKIVLDYARLDALRRLLSGMGGRIIAEDYQIKVSLAVSVPVDCEEKFCAAMAGMALLEKMETETVS